MKKIKIYSILENSDNETTKIEALASYDENKGILKYSEEDLNVEIELFKDKVIIKRKNDEYDTNLEFELNSMIFGIATSLNSSNLALIKSTAIPLA